MTEILETALLCIDALEAEGLDCAIGGALALGFWSPPRATLDVDLNIFVEAVDAQVALQPLINIGAIGNSEQMVKRLQQGEAAILHLHGVHLDIFLPSIPFYKEAAQRVARVPYKDRTLPVLSAEVLAVFKLLFFRPKDLADLERLVAFLGENLDAAWVRSQVAEMMGEEDERVVAWDRIALNG